MELNNNPSKSYLFVRSIFLLDQSTDTNKNKNHAKKVIENMEKNRYDKNVPYPVIAQYIYENEDIDPSFEETVDRYFGEKYPVFADKFKRHVNLSLTQKEYIQQSMTDRITDSQKEINSLSERYELLEEKAQKMSSEYISILGIFSALIFGLFGGFNVLTSAFNIFIESSTYGQAIFYVSILALSLITFIYFLLYWIGIIIDNPIHNTDSGYTPGAISNVINKVNSYLHGEYKKEVSFIRKHQTYLTIVTSLLVTALVGIELSIIESHFMESLDSYLILLLVVLLPIIGLTIFLVKLLIKGAK